MTFNDCNSSSTLTDGNRIYFNFTRQPVKWIYCNYPERLQSDALGDSTLGNHFLNQVQVNGDYQLYASYMNQTGYDIKFGVQLYNSGSSSVTVTRYNNAHRTSPPFDYCDVEGGIWADFFNSSGTTSYTVAPYSVVWIFEEDVPVGGYFNSLVRFHTSGNLWCFPYVYTNSSNIDGTATCYPWNTASQVYRGHGDSYFISGWKTLNISNMPYKYFTSTCGSGNTNEMTEIHDYCSGINHSCSSGANLGNWGMQYLFNITVNNDTGAARTIKAYIGAASAAHAYVAVNYNNTTKWCCRDGNTWWNWLTDTIPKDTSRFLFNKSRASLRPRKKSIRIVVSRRKPLCVKNFPPPVLSFFP